TIRGSFARALVGERVLVGGVRLHDGSVRASRLQVLSHVHSANLIGTVMGRLAGGTLLASGRSMVGIRPLARSLASASDHGDLRPGEVANFQIRFEDDDLIEAAPPVEVGQA